MDDATTPDPPADEDVRAPGPSVRRDEVRVAATARARRRPSATARPCGCRLRRRRPPWPPRRQLTPGRRRRGGADDEPAPSTTPRRRRRPPCGLVSADRRAATDDDRANRAGRGQHDPGRAPRRAAHAGSSGRDRRRRRRGHRLGSSTSRCFDFLLEPYCDVAARTRTSDRRQAACVTDPLEGVQRPHQDHDLHGHRPRHAGDPLAALAVRHAGPLLEREALRHPVRRLRRSSCSSSAPAIAFWTCPKALEFLADIGGDELRRSSTHPSKYLRLIIYMMLAFGIGFEFPILLVFLQMAGVLSRPTSCAVAPLRHRGHRASSSP